MILILFVLFVDMPVCDSFQKSVFEKRITSPEPQAVVSSTRGWGVGSGGGEGMTTYQHANLLQYSH